MRYCGAKHPIRHRGYESISKAIDKLIQADLVVTDGTA
jgi:hypothetical protein